MENLNESRQKCEENEAITTLLIAKVTEIANKHGIEEIKSRVIEAGEVIEVVFDIHPPKDHLIEWSEKTRGNLLNAGIKTSFTESSLMPFVREFTKGYGDYFELEFTKSGDEFQFKIKRNKI